jgi:chromosome segregation ATPase
MSKKDGAVFSKSLFGYKKRDVNEYIRQLDEINSETIKDYESRMDELQKAFAAEKDSYESKIEQLNVEKEAIAEEFQNSIKEYKTKLEDSESRCASYLKLADAASMRAEEAANRIAGLSAELEIKNSELQILKDTIESHKKQIEKLNAAISHFAEREEKEKNESVKYFKFRRPTFFKIVKK